MPLSRVFHAGDLGCAWLVYVYNTQKNFRLFLFVFHFLARFPRLIGRKMITGAKM